MIKNKTLSTGLLALTIGVVGFGAGLATQGVSADAMGGDEESQDMEMHQNMMMPFDMMMPFEEIDRQVTDLENGVQIEITSEDPEIVKMIQERANNQGLKGHHGKQAPHSEQ